MSQDESGLQGETIVRCAMTSRFERYDQELAQAWASKIQAAIDKILTIAKGGGGDEKGTQEGLA